MGKLAELRDELYELENDNPRVPELQKEINKIEKWCIDNNPDWGVKLSVWGNSSSKVYPWHSGAVHLDDIYMVASLNGKGINLEHDGTAHLCDNC